ncbi:MAG: 3-oxoacyl-[acyl-carrier-protein] reductase [Saprospiraceae bacterium]|nr:3-oxoacyl-[acyl-carrier-protein] reductase [Saprospiraceae bacterium]
MKLLDGKTALITGGSRGIGASIVRLFAEHGAEIAFTYASSASSSETIVTELSGITKIKAYQSDAASITAAEKLVKDVMADFGKIDILVNNAGITKDGLLLRMSEEMWDTVIDVNLKSVFNLTKFAIKSMLRTGGSIINMSSVVGVFGNSGQANYAASKAGIIGFSKSVAKELGSKNIRCNVIAPGFISTEMTHVLDDSTKDAFLSNIPLKRLGESREIANTTLFLASDLSSYITGQVLNVCGGMAI